MSDKNNQNENSENILINLRNKEIELIDDTFIRENPTWLQARDIILAENNIKQLNTSLLPVTLKYLDISDNIELINFTGIMNTPELTTLLLQNSGIHKLPKLPESLETLNISNTPLARKYPYIDHLINNKRNIKLVTDTPFSLGDIMINNTPIPEILHPNKNSNENSNETELEDSDKLVMITGRRETDTDIIYRVQLLNGTEQEIMKYHLHPYEPRFAERLQPQNPIDERGIPMVYTINAHGEDLLFEKPVPPGCVYVTMEECGDKTKLKDFTKLLMAFNNKPEGILEKLRDPVKHRFYLTSYFGRSFHVHYPEAEEHENRTYLDNIHVPNLSWNYKEKGCHLYKSGIYNLNNGVNFDIIGTNLDYTIAEGRNGLPYAGRYIPTPNITMEDLYYMYNESLFPTFNAIHDVMDIDDVFKPGHDSITFNTMLSNILKFEFTQSWAFKMFPGIHYNFTCRVVKKHPGRNENVIKRRRGSVLGKISNLSRLSNINVKGEIGYELLKSFVESGQDEMIALLIQKGINVNRRDSKGRTLLQDAIYSFKIPVIQELMKSPGIDRSNALEELERAKENLISNEKNIEGKLQIQKEAIEIRALLSQSSGGRRPYKNYRKTRRSKNKKHLAKYTRRS
jgi:hypothetical protein